MARRACAGAFGLQHTKTHINAGLFQAVAVAVSRSVCLRQSAHFSPRSVVGGHEAFYPGCPRCRMTGYRRVKGRRDGALQGDWDSRCRLTGWAGTVGEQRHFSNCAATKVALSSGMVNPRRVHHLLPQIEGGFVLHRQRLRSRTGTGVSVSVPADDGDDVVGDGAGEAPTVSRSPRVCQLPARRPSGGQQGRPNTPPL